VPTMACGGKAAPHGVKVLWNGFISVARLVLAIALVIAPRTRCGIGLHQIGEEEKWDRASDALVENKRAIMCTFVGFPISPRKGGRRAAGAWRSRPAPVLERSWGPLAVFDIDTFEAPISYARPEKSSRPHLRLHGGPRDGCETLSIRT